MRGLISKIVFPLILLCGSVSLLFAQGSAADYQRAANLGRLTANKVFRDRIEPHWFANNTQFTYRVRTGPSTHEFVRVNAMTGQRDIAFDHAKLAPKLRDAGVRNAHADRLEIDQLEYLADNNAVTFRAGGKSWRCTLADYELAAVNPEDIAQRQPDAPADDAPSARDGDTFITFINKTAGKIELFWLSDADNAVSYGVLEAGEEHRQHTFVGHEWSVRDTKGKVLLQTAGVAREVKLEIDGIAPPRPRRERGPRDRDANSNTSPDRKWRASIDDYNVVLRNVDSNEETRLTTDGSVDDSFNGRFYWSPDSLRLVALRTQPGDDRQVTIVDSTPRDQVQPKLLTYDYLKPGDKVSITKPSLFNIETKRQIPVSDELFQNPFSTGNFRWEPDGRRFSFTYNARGHQALRIIAIDGESGAVTTIVNEESPTFIDYAQKNFAHRLEETNELIWMSERDGWNHLYLYNTLTGEVQNQITKGEWVVRGVEHVDAEHRQIWFRAGGIYPEQDPYYIHYCRINFDGTGLVKLTAGDGTHSIAYSPDRRFIIDTYSRVDLAPVTELRRADDGSLICELERGDLSALSRTGWQTPERFVAKGRDGETDIYGIILRPTNFDASQKYPVIEDIYAGPQSSFVPKSFSPYMRQQSMAELGFIVVKIDGLGTSNRSKKFHDVCWKNLGDAGFPDRIAWMRAVAAKYPQLDLTRVGIYGGSAGGQNAAGAVLTHGEFYKVAVADCGCHDNRMDKIWWNELWMGWPVGPHYAEQSNVTRAHRLQGKLMLVVGELDRNVDPASTMQVASALVKANKDFDLLIIPGAGHGACETPYGQRRRQDFFVRHLLGVEPRHGS